MAEKSIFIVTLKDDATEEEIAEAKKHVVENGGEIIKGSDHTLFRGFDVKYDSNSISTLEAGPNVLTVELSGPVHTQETT